MKVAVALCSEHQITRQFSPLPFLVIPWDFPNRFFPPLFFDFFFFFFQTPSHTFGHRQWDLPPFLSCKCVHDKLSSVYLTDPGFLQGWEWEQEDFEKGFISFFCRLIFKWGTVKQNLIFQEKRGRKKKQKKGSIKTNMRSSQRVWNPRIFKFGKALQDHQLQPSTTTMFSINPHPQVPDPHGFWTLPGWRLHPFSGQPVPLPKRNFSWNLIDMKRF